MRELDLSAIYGIITIVTLRTVKLPEFVEWFEELDIKGQAQVGRPYIENSDK